MCRCRCSKAAEHSASGVASNWASGNGPDYEQLGGLVSSVGNWKAKRQMTDPVQGKAFVVSANNWTRAQVPSPLRAKFVVEADGVPKTTVEHSEKVPPKLWEVWPSPKQTLPVTIDRADPTRLVIDWQQLLDDKEQRQRAAAEREEQRLLQQAYRRK
jgi:hypothetical protein